MNGRILFVAAALASTVGVALPSPVARAQAGQAPTFRSTTSAVSVDVSVRDRGRKPVVGLTAADFTVLDNGVKQTVTEVSYGVRPIDITVGLDVSGSVTGPVLDRLRRGIVQLMGDLGRNDRLKLMLFNTQVHRSIDFTADVKAVEKAIRAVPAGGGTALYDALSVAMVGAAEPERRQLIVFFTDGADSGSATPPAMLQLLAERARASLAFVVSTTVALPGISTGNSIVMNLGRPVDPLLTRLAADTGGTVLPIAAAVDLGSTFRRILSDFRSAYVIFFSPTGVERKGFHTIEVQVGRPEAVIQARRGYFGG